MNGVNLSIDTDEKNIIIQIHYSIIYPDKYTDDEILAGSDYEEKTLKFDNVYISTGQVGGLYTSIAYQIDGKYYDLSKYINVL